MVDNDSLSTILAHRDAVGRGRPLHRLTRNSGVRQALRRRGPRSSLAAADAGAEHPRERSGGPAQTGRQLIPPTPASMDNGHPFDRRVDQPDYAYPPFRLV